MNLASSNTAAATVPASVTVLAGATTATFTASTKNVSAAASVTVTATQGNVSKTATLTVSPLQVTLSANVVQMPSGGSAIGTATLTGAAPAGGVSVALSSNSTVVTLPASVTVPAGATSATFPITAGTSIGTTSVTLTASLNGSSKTKSLSVLAPPGQLSALVVSPDVGVGGQTSTIGIRLSDNAPAGGVVVQLTSSDPTIVSLPATATVPAGQNRLDLSVAIPAGVPDTTVRLTATSGVVTVTKRLGDPAGRHLTRQLGHHCRRCRKVRGWPDDSRIGPSLPRQLPRAD